MAEVTEMEAVEAVVEAAEEDKRRAEALNLPHTVEEIIGFRDLFRLFIQRVKHGVGDPR